MRTDADHPARVRDPAIELLLGHTASRRLIGGYSDGRAGSGLEVPYGAAVADPFVVGFNVVGVEQLVLVPFAEVPVEAQRRESEVGPTVADGEIPEVDVARPGAAARDEGVGGAGVAVDEHRPRAWSATDLTPAVTGLSTDRDR